MTDRQRAYFDRITLQALAGVEENMSPEQKAIFDEKVEELMAMVNFTDHACLLTFQDGVRKGLLAAQLVKVET